MTLLTLGNHTLSHTDYDTVSIETYTTEILQGDIVTRRLMQPRRPYRLYFRSPKTHTRDTRAKKDALLATLAAHHYTLAPHTVENQDFVFNQAYNGAFDDHDSAGAARVSDGLARRCDGRRRVSYGRHYRHEVWSHVALAVDEVQRHARQLRR